MSLCPTHLQDSCFAGIGQAKGSPLLKYTERACKALYQKLCGLPRLHPSERYSLWLRLHLLLQTYQQLVSSACTPEQLQEIWQSPPQWFDEKAPAIRFLLGEFPLRHHPELPRDLLAAFCDLYRTAFVPDLGILYLYVQPKSDKKRKGQLFTPEHVIQHAFSLLRHPIQGRLLDLSCGAGDYLLVAYRKLRARYEAVGWSKQAAHEHILQHYLFGADIDPLAVAITKSRLALECLQSPLPAPNIFTQNAYLVFSHPLGQQSYQLIIGNPPWGSVLNQAEKRWIDRYFLSCSGGRKLYNSFLYFLEASVRLLSSQGLLSLLLPAAFLNVQSYAPLRKWLLEQVEIDVLHYAPNLFRSVKAPALFLSAAKTTPLPDHTVRVCMPNAPQNAIRTIEQRVFAKEEHAIFNIYYNEQLEPLFQRMHKNSFYMQSGPIQDIEESECLVDYVLGIVTGNNRQHLTQIPDDQDSELIYSAHDLSRFRLAAPKHYIRYDKHTLQQAAPQHKYKVPEKLLYKFISKELIVAIDRSGHYTVNNVNAILPLQLPVSMRYLAGLLNSTLLNAYYMYKFFTGKVTASHLSALPLRRPSIDAAAQMEVLVTSLEQAAAPLQPSLLRALDSAVYRLYGVTTEQQRLVEQLYQQMRQMTFL